MDVLAVPSLWPENSPLVIHEAFQAGLPVVGSRLGGTADLVADGTNGLLYEAFSAADLAAALRRLLDEAGLLDRLAAGVPAVKSIDQDAGEWEERYRRLVLPRREAAR
jgi:glycosyltransferase involved in cell wall biosynthesis